MPLSQKPPNSVNPSHYQRSQHRQHAKSFYERSNSGAKSDSDQSATTTVKEICQPSCWCNNLVEVTCRYPTKVVTYVTLIEANSSVSHELNMLAFDQQIVQSHNIAELKSKSTSFGGKDVYPTSLLSNISLAPLSNILSNTSRFLFSFFQFSNCFKFSFSRWN